MRRFWRSTPDIAEDLAAEAEEFLFEADEPYATVTLTLNEMEVSFGFHSDTDRDTTIHMLEMALAVAESRDDDGEWFFSDEEEID